MKLPHNIGRLEALKYGIPGFIYVLLGPLCYLHAARFQKKYPNML